MSRCTDIIKLTSLTCDGVIEHSNIIFFSPITARDWDASDLSPWQHIDRIVT